MTALKTIIMTTAIVGLSACSAFEGNNEVETLNQASASGSPFTQQLTSEYRAFADFELNSEKDYADALHFARKGMEAAKGVNVMPEQINDWDVTAAQIAELSEGYTRLVSAIDRGAREVLPGKAAIAQARFDCWVEDEEEVAAGKASDVNCKADFLTALSELEAALPVAAPEQPMAEEFPAPVTMIDTNEPLNIAEAMYLVFFDFDSSSVNNEGMDVIQTVVNEMQSRNIAGVDIVGHTDTSGPDDYNDRLANRRAASIKGELVARGIPADSITVSGRGESELLVQTQDGIREPANRRGVITFK